MNTIREGIIAGVLGAAVTAVGYAAKQNRKIDKMVSNTLFGFGIHILSLERSIFSKIEMNFSLSSYSSIKK
ncbi:hypothetical protein [Mesobacillus subterraneus]|uniref:hypothetical protein n=1 Tax=Mesobacillus subterraneus TaxID=285983 RepID=UPI0035325B87